MHKQGRTQNHVKTMLNLKYGIKIMAKINSYDIYNTAKRFFPDAFLMMPKHFSEKLLINSPSMEKKKNLSMIDSGNAFKIQPTN